MQALKLRTASLYCILYLMGSQVRGLESGGGVVRGARTNDNLGESILDTLDTCYVVLGRSVENGICIV